MILSNLLYTFGSPTHCILYTIKLIVYSILSNFLYTFGSLTDRILYVIKLINTLYVTNLLTSIVHFESPTHCLLYAIKIIVYSMLSNSLYTFGSPTLCILYIIELTVLPCIQCGSRCHYRRSQRELWSWLRLRLSRLLTGAGGSVCSEIDSRWAGSQPRRVQLWPFICCRRRYRQQRLSRCVIFQVCCHP